MPKRILIAEDDPRFKVLYRDWTRSNGYNVVEATSLDEGLVKLALADALVTDFGLEAGNGNQLARAAKQQRLPVAGITGGSTSNFDLRYVDIPETKAINQGNFKTLLECLFTPNPRQAYNSRKQEQEQISYELPCAASILFQGYYMLKALNTGLEEVESDGQVVISREMMQHFREMRFGQPGADPKSLFKMFEDGELNPGEVYDVACKLSPSLQTDLRLKTIFDMIAERNYDFSVDQAVYASRKLVEGCK